MLGTLRVDLNLNTQIADITEYDIVTRLVV